ncbi:hypothetical protein [Streptomyces sp. NPDC001275]
MSDRSGRLLLRGEAAGVDLCEDIELDQAFQLGAGALDVLRQQIVVEGFADIAGPEGAGGLVEDGEDTGVVRVLGQVGRGRVGGEPFARAVIVTMGLLNCDLAEAQRAFFNAPCRDVERRFHNHAMDLLEEAADTDA